MRRDEPPTLLIVEDDLDLADMLSAFFRGQGYAVTATAWGEQAVRLAAEHPPDLIMLDIRLPDIDGFEISRRLRSSHRTRYVPIIFLTERRARLERLQGLAMGVTDYITKPFDIHELRLRVHNSLQRAADLQSAHPVTGLPEPERALAAVARIASLSPGERGLLVVTLRGLWAFRELYGFIAGDDVLRMISLTLSHAASELCDESGQVNSFCGHLDDDAFVLITEACEMEVLRARIVERLRGTLELFYPADNRGEHAHTSDRLALAIAEIATPLDSADPLDDLKRALLDAPPTLLVE